MNRKINSVDLETLNPTRAVQRSLYNQNKTPRERDTPPHEITLHPGHMDDLTLWKALKSGDEKALVTVFERFTGPMFNYGYKIARNRELVKDTIQELLIEIWKNRSRLGDTDSIKFYLYKSLRRKLARAQAASQNNILTKLSVEYEREVTPSHEFILIREQVSIEKKEKLKIMLSTLTRRQQEVMYLRYFEELNCEQIALVTDLNKQTVYNLIHQSITQLRKSVGQ